MNPNWIIDKKFLPAMSRIFTPVVMDSLAERGFSPYLSEVCANSGILRKVAPSMTLGNFLDEIYSLLDKRYRNEYIYKNVITNKILLGKHSLNTSRMLTEFRVGRNKADVVILNGTSTVYEIKTEYDTFKRLQSQVKSYQEAFDFINVITSPAQVVKLKAILPEGIGILALTDRNTISTIRDGKPHKENFNSALMFDSLRKDEYTSIIREYYGSLPEVPNTLIFEKCKELFCQISPIDAHDLAIKVLKERATSNVLKTFIDQAPYSISAYAVSICEQERKLLELLSLFNDKIETFLFRKQVKYN